MIIKRPILGDEKSKSAEVKRDAMMVSTGRSSPTKAESRPMTPTSISGNSNSHSNSHSSSHLSPRLYSVSTRTPSPKCSSSQWQSQQQFTTPSLSPIMLHSYYSHANTSHGHSTAKKRRVGIVRRTHSPKSRHQPKHFFAARPAAAADATSPLHKPNISADQFSLPSLHHKHLNSTNPTTRSASALSTPPSLLKPKLLLTSPTSATHPSNSNHASSSALTAQLTRPTLTNVIQCTQRLKSSSIILSFPTETVYSLTTHVPLLASTNQATRKHHNSNTWKTLLQLRRSHHTYEHPMIYLYSPNQAKQLIQLPKHTKTPRRSITTTQEQKVMERLMSAFWPGPVPIYAPVKQLLLLSSPTITDLPPNKKRKLETKTITNNTISTSHKKTFPILPKTTLVPYSHLLPNSTDSTNTTSTDTTDQYFVGMRCPSHPLSRRLLGEFYFDNQQQQTNKSNHHTRTKLTGAIIGFNVPSTTTSKDVVSHLSMHKYGSKRKENPVTIHVLDGEDKQELFMVPPCQFGSNYSSLLVDFSARTVHILHPTKTASTTTTRTTHTSTNITIDSVRRALLQPKSNNRKLSQGSTGSSSEGDSAIFSVMSQWKVVETHHNNQSI